MLGVINKNIYYTNSSNFTGSYYHINSFLQQPTKTGWHDSLCV